MYNLFKLERARSKCPLAAVFSCPVYKSNKFCLNFLPHSKLQCSDLEIKYPTISRVLQKIASLALCVFVSIKLPPTSLEGDRQTDKMTGHVNLT